MGRTPSMAIFRRLAVVSLSFLSIAGMPSAGAAQDVRTDRLSISFPREDLSIQRETIGKGTLTRVRFAGADLTDAPGYPRLPWIVRTLVLPGGAKILRLSTASVQTVKFSDVPFVEWAQLPRAGRDPFPPPDGEEAASPPPRFVGLDPTLPGMDVWPPEIVEVQSIDQKAGYEVVHLRLYPVRWLPREGALSFVPSLEVVVSSSGGEVPAARGYAQAMAVEDMASRVENPDALVKVPLPLEALDPEAWYLIVTDNYAWHSDFTRGPAVDGDMVAEFRRLAEWKTEKGVKAKVVTVSDILGNRYGPFKAEARDVQEALRNFLKHACWEWSTAWILIGGDVEIVPPREVVMNGNHSSHSFGRAEDAKPSEGACYWDPASSTVRIHHDAIVAPDTKIACNVTGKAFSRVTGPSASKPGWAYVTSDSYATESATATNHIILRGPLADVELTSFYAALYCNTIPTDLYYASLFGITYDLPGYHDWDLNGNGIYGQTNGTTAIDGVLFGLTVPVGRAPVASAAEAKAFVDKVLAYEKYEGIPSEFGRKLLIGSANWSKGATASPTTTNPPEEKKYYSAANSFVARLHLEEPPSMDKAWRLIAWNGPGDWWEVPYDESPSAQALGHYFCTDETYSTVAKFVYDIGPYEIEIPIHTNFVRVVGPSTQVRPGKYFFEALGPDQSVQEKEEVKGLLAAEAPALDLRKRLYQDFDQTPGYPDPDLFELSQPLMQAELDAGYNIVSLSGHGNVKGCAGVSRDWVGSLTNGFAGGIIYADSCLTNEFNQDDAVSEVFLKTAGGGAVGYVGNSRYSWVGGGAPIEREFWHHLTVDRHLGRLFNTRLSFGNSTRGIWTIHSLNLMGDPEMHVRIGSPPRMSVIHEAYVAQGLSFAVRVQDPLGRYTPGSARVCLTGPKGLFRLLEPDAKGGVVIPALPTRAGDELVLTVSPGPAESFVPYRATIAVVAATWQLGDVDADGARDITDVIFLLGYQFLGYPRTIPCEAVGDTTVDGKLDISDAVRLLGFLFLGDKLADVKPVCP